MARWFAMVRHELYRALRDSNTLMYLGFPLVAYPMIILAATQSLPYLEAFAERQELRVALHGDLDEAILGADDRLVVHPGDLVDLDAGRLDAVLEAKERSVVVHHRSGAARSRRAARALASALEEAGTTRLHDDARALGADPALLEGLTLKLETTDEDGAMMRWVLAVLAAVMAPTSLVIGSMSPVTELFVSERERGCLETTLTAAVPHGQIVLARLIAASLLGLGAGLGNLGAFALTIAHGAALLHELRSFPVPTVFEMVAILCLLSTGSLVVAAIQVAIVSLAQTFRQAQTLLSNGMLLLIVPSTLATLAVVANLEDSLLLMPLAHTGTLCAAAVNGTLIPWQLGVVLVEDLLLLALLYAVASRTIGMAALLAGIPRPRWLLRLFGETP